jgi:NAD(P)-dependent dehydrogenase (short-subunit alcohol dehydrogenase family)
MDSDAASLADIDTLADRVKAEFGTLDVLFVNAGLTRFVCRGPHHRDQRGRPDPSRAA